MAHDPDLDPILKDLRGADAALAQRLDGIAARLERLEAAPPVPAPPAPEAPKPAEPLPAKGSPAGFSKIGDLKIDRRLTFDWSAFDIYLPQWGVGPKSLGRPSLLDWQPDGSVIVNAGFGERDPATGRSWHTGAMQGQNGMRHALGRMGAEIHVTRPHAVAAFFAHADNAKEIDFELTFLDGKPGWSPAVHMPRTGGGRVSSSRRIMRRAPLADRVQRLEYDLRPDRCDFYCDEQIFETIYPADMAEGGTWDTTTVMTVFLSVEHHDAWAGWGAGDYARGAQMRVHAVTPKAVWIEKPDKAPLPRPAAGGTAVDPAPRTINGGAWLFTQKDGSTAGIAADGRTVVMGRTGTGESSARATFAVTPGVRHRASFSVQGYLSVTGAGQGWAGLSSGNHVRDFVPAKDSETITVSASRATLSQMTNLRIEAVRAV